MDLTQIILIRFVAHHYPGLAVQTDRFLAVCPRAFETFDDVADQLPKFIDGIDNQSKLHSALGYVSPAQI